MNGNDNDDRDLIGFAERLEAERNGQRYVLPRMATDEPTKPGEELRPIRHYTAGALEDEFPELHRPVVDGLVRERETINIVSVSKIGKSWLLYSLLLCIVTGGTWLGRFTCRRGRVLLIDNELHKPTIAYRIKTVALALEIQPNEYRDMLEIVPVRGLGWSILDIARFVKTIDERFAFIAVDAKYRAMASGTDENSNTTETQFFNEVDRIGETTGSTVGLVHHSTKGWQGEKRVTDVGAGAGAQSRAADTHLILREHDESGAAVLDAAVRSFPPVEPIALRWEFPLWVPDGTLDVKALKGRQANGNQAEKDAESDIAVLDACQTWKTRREIRKATGYGEARTDRAIARLERAKYLEPGREDRPRHPQSEVFRKTIHAR